MTEGASAESAELGRFKSTKRNEVPLERQPCAVLFDEDILDNILARLPLAAKCRCRCVCSKWKDLLSSSFSSRFSCSTGPSCLIVGVYDDSRTQFFCHLEKEWHDLPMSVLPPSEVKWLMWDVEGGLVCYAGCLGGYLNLAVCNPLKYSSRIIASDYLVRNWEGSRDWDESSVSVKLLVDGEKKMFKLILLTKGANAANREESKARTRVFDSITSRWDVFPSHPCDISGACRYTFFIWKNIVYAASGDEASDFFLAFDMEVGKWHKVKVQFPQEWPVTPTMKYEVGVGRHHGKNQVVLLKPGVYTDEEFPCVWKLLDNALSNVPDFSLSRWEKIGIDEYPDMQLGDVRSTNTFQGDGCLCFAIDGIWDGEVYVEVWLKYTYDTKSFDILYGPADMRWQNCYRV